MASQPHQPTPLVLILPDNTALLFAATQKEPEHSPSDDGVRTRGERLGAYLKSFLPKVSKVTPVETQLPSGRQLQVMAPAASL